MRSKRLPLCNWLRIRAHVVLLNLWRLCFCLNLWGFCRSRILCLHFLLLPLCIISLRLLWWTSHLFYPLLSFLVLYLVFFPALSSQFPSVVPYPLFPPSTILFPSLLRTPHPLPPPPFCFFSLGPLAVSPQVMFSWPDDACISLVSSWC